MYPCSTELLANASGTPGTRVRHIDPLPVSGIYGPIIGVLEEAWLVTMCPTVPEGK